MNDKDTKIVLSHLTSTSSIPITSPRRLKVFSLLSVKKGFDFESVRDKFQLSLVSSFDREEADQSVQSIMRDNGQNPEDWHTSVVALWSFFEDLVPPVSLARMIGNIVMPMVRTKSSERSELELLEDRRRRGVNELVSYIRYACAESQSTPDELSVVEGIINRLKLKYEPGAKNVSESN